MSVHRIVAITAMCIDSNREINFEDLDYSATEYALFNVLETTHDIFDACLPVTPPIMMRLLGRGYIMWSSLQSASERNITMQRTQRDTNQHDRLRKANPG